MIHAQCSGKYVCEQSYTYYTGQLVSHPSDIVPGRISLSFHNDIFFQGSGGTLEKHLFPTPSAHKHHLNMAISFLQTHRQTLGPGMTYQFSSLPRDSFKNGHMP